MKKCAAILFLMCFVLRISEGQTHSKAFPKSLFISAKGCTPNNKQIRINLINGFDVTAKIEECFTKLVTYSNLRIINGKTEILWDTSSEFEIDSKNPVRYRALKNGNFEILIVLNDRPLKNKLRRLIISRQKIIKDDSLPEDILVQSNSGYFEGFMDNNESVCMKCDSVVYNPMLIYQFSEAGIELDSIQTIKNNKKLYGDFYGYKYREDIILKVSNKK